MTEIPLGVRSIETLTSALYEDPIIVFREYVQNAMDSKIRSKRDGKNMDDFAVSIDVDKKSKNIVIEDNGYAIPRDMFVKTMRSISASENKPDNVGFRGIGRLSAMLFCKKLVFESKAEGQNCVDICEWNGDEYSRILDESPKDLLGDRIDDFTTIYERPHDAESHFFRVTIVEYSSEIERVMKLKDFMLNLTKILPLRYSDKFTESDKIFKKYKATFGRDFQDYVCEVKFNGISLEKQYTNELLGDSGMVFIEIKAPNHKGKMEPLGLLWFTFERKIEVDKTWQKEGLFGILVRSKNMLMGDNLTFAEQTILSDDPFTTRGELVAQLGGISGELLICSKKLKDNARRDWFRLDLESKMLRNQIADFMKRLKQYRYAASKYVKAVKDYEEEKDSAETEMIKRQEIAIDALAKLVTSDYEDVIKKFYKQEKPQPVVSEEGQSSEEQKGSSETENPSSEESSGKGGSEEDVPRPSVIDIPNLKIHWDFYDDLMGIIEKFMKEQKNYILFNKMRAYIREQIQKGETNGKDTSCGAGLQEQVSSDRVDEDRDVP